MISALRSAILAFAVASLPGLTLAATKDLGNGFRDHGVCAPISNHRGTVATTTPDGHNVLLLWLMDHRGGYALLLADATTGKVQAFPVPFKFKEFDAPFASILSSANKFYTHQNSHFIEFDPATRAFTFSHKSAPQMAMAMTEDDNGVIWSVTYPNSGLVSFDPKTKAFTDYGSLHKETWQQYDRSLAADDAGYIYFAIGNTSSQIIAFDPTTRKATAILPAAERKQGSAYLYRDLDGKVYGQALRDDKEPWYELYKGAARKLDSHPTLHPKNYVSGSQALNETTFPDGTRADADLVNRVLTVENPETKDRKQYPFDYSSDGAIVMEASASPDGHTVLGGTTFPMRCFTYDPKTDSLTNVAAYGQWNTAQRQGDHFFVFGYPHGFLLDYNPAQPWVPTVKDKPGNPQFLIECLPTIYRPTKLLALPDNRRLVCAGTPDYGYTGGGLLLWDRTDSSHALLKDTDLIPNQSTESIVALDDNTILAGTTTQPGTGGEKKAHLAELYTLDLANHKITWHAPLLPGTQEYTDLAPAPNGLVYGVADAHLFFVFDPKSHTITHQFDTTPTLGTTAHEQGPRLFIQPGDGTTYLLFKKGIAKVDPANHALTLVAKSPLPIEAGGDLVDGRIYFISGSHLCSYQLK